MTTMPLGQALPLDRTDGAPGFWYPHWRDALPDWQWPNFTPSEMACRGSGELVVVPSFMTRLQCLRDEYARPITVTSGYRTPAYNAKVSRDPAAPHPFARAVDVAVFGADSVDLIVLAKSYGFTGFGDRQHGPFKERFVHLDDLGPADGRPRPWKWSYP